MLTSFTNSAFWQLKTFEFFDCIEKFFLQRISARQLQHTATSRTGESARHSQEIPTHRLYGRLGVSFAQTEAFKPVDQIVSQHHCLEESDIGHPAAARNLIQGQVVEQFANDFLDDRPQCVKAPYSPRGEAQIGDQHFVGVTPISEQGQLESLLRVLGDWSANNYKTPGLGPAVRLVGKFRYLPAVLQFSELPGLRPAPDRGLLFGHDCIAAALVFQHSQQLPIVESGIGSHPHTTARHSGRDLGQTALHKPHGSSMGHRISGSEGAVPELLPLGFEAQQRMIRAAAPLFGVVTQASALLLSVNGKHHTVQIEDQRRAGLGQTEQPLAQSVVQPYQLADRLRFYALQKTTQRRGIRKAIQTQQRKERTIVLQNFGPADPSKSGDQNIEHRQEQVGWLEVATSGGGWLRLVAATIADAGIDKNAASGPFRRSGSGRCPRTKTPMFSGLFPSPTRLDCRFEASGNMFTKSEYIAGMQKSRREPGTTRFFKPLFFISRFFEVKPKKIRSRQGLGFPRPFRRRAIPDFCRKEIVRFCSPAGL